MWQCSKCREKVEDSFEICWNCGTSQDGTEDPGFRIAEDVTPSSDHADQVASDPIFCLRCNRQLDYVGTKKFHEGTRALSFLFGDFGELFVNREHFDVYVCPRCGRVEFFVGGIGEQFRPH